MQRITEYLANKNSYIVADGAMGTMLYSKGAGINKCFELLNIEQEKLVREVHQEYIKAGAKLIFTNTFGGNSFRLAKHSLAGKVEEINRRAVKIAKEAAEKSNVWIGASIGPIGQAVEPYGRVKKTEAEEAFYQQAKVLIEEEVDLIALETFLSITEASIALEAVNRVKAELKQETPVALLFSFDHQGKSDTGRTAKQVMRTVKNWKVDIFGANCSTGPQPMLKVMQEMASETSKPLLAKPNAGMPEMKDGRLIYMATPDYFLTYAKRFMKVGVRVLGGCCGSTPEHIKYIANCVKAYGYSESDVVVNIEEKKFEENKVDAVALKDKSPFARKLSEGKFVVSVEVLPPRGANPTKVIEAIKRLKGAGVDAVNVPDGPRASARMSSMALCQLIISQAGMEPIIHYTCRDRNLLGMQSDLLGANAIGIHNILAITGDPPKLGNYPDATAVYDVDSIGLTKMMNNLNHGIDIVGNSIGEATAICIGVAANPGSLDIEQEMERLRKKVENGAEFIMTQPVFDAEYLHSFMKRIKEFKIPVLVGILPIASHKVAEFLHNEVPGMQLPENIRKRMKKAGDGEDGKAEGIELAREALRQTKEMVEGAYIMAPVGGVNTALKVIEGIIERH
ncbi:MAG: bifunctional homocysteine S-methyltransferase/methylenetetrahydrofolate reductase [Nitrospinae bacterium]|nr:bifunctional homocysteine S-methyltransferase/methylenetetrahydrofolate reductase [Nitrospinota bacterium]